MPDLTDMELLRDFTRHRSDEAFAELVRRHINLVFSTALRHVGIAAHAEEITQAVFVIFAQKAARLRPDTILEGWLYETTRFTSLSFLRGERRRHAREQQAYMQSTLSESTTASAWEQLAPLLDEAMAQLCKQDRDAVVLRFFKGKNVREIAVALNVTEGAAQRRGLRALEKLRVFFAKRGLALTTTMIAGAVSANSIQAAPVALANAITAIAISKGAIAAGSALTLVEGASKLMAWAKLKTAAVSGIVIACVVVPLVIHNQEQTRLRQQLRIQAEHVAELKAENQRLSNQLQTRIAMPRLPAPTIRKPVKQSQTLGETTNLISRLIRGEDVPKLTAEQIESYLKENQRSAGSLIAAFRASGDQTFLQEALQKYPNDPLVNFAAVFSKDLSAEERRPRLDALKHSAPENALGDFLSALDYFRAGETDHAVQELSAAFSKKDFQDFTRELIQNSEEAYLAAGYSVAEAKTLATSQVLLPQLAALKELSQNMIELANSYSQSGDETSAQAALQIATNLGQRFNGSPGEPLISHFVGMVIERNALQAMDPDAPFGAEGQTVNDRLQQLARRNAELNELARQFESVQHQMTPQDWVSYTDRWRTFGEQAAAQWLVNKYRRD